MAAVEKQCLLCHRKRTCAVHEAMSAKGQKRTFAPANCDATLNNPKKMTGRALIHRFAAPGLSHLLKIVPLNASMTQLNWS